MKRFLAAALAVLTVFCFVGCGNFSDSTGGDSASSGNGGDNSSSTIIEATWEEISSGLYQDTTNEKSFYVTSADGLLAFGGIINGDIDYAPIGYTKSSMKNATIQLKADVDMSNKPWTPLQVVGVNGMTIDGNGHAIQNLSLSPEHNPISLNNESGMHKIGFIGECQSDLTIKNLTFVNAVAKDGLKWVGIVCGYHLDGALRLENVDVKNSEIIGSFINDDSKRLGMLVGLTQFGNSLLSLTLIDCNVENCKISGYEAVAGLVGTLHQLTEHTHRWTISNCSVKNCVFKTGNLNEKLVNTFAVANWIVEVDEAYFTDLGNTCSNNTLEWGVAE